VGNAEASTRPFGDFFAEQLKVATEAIFGFPVASRPPGDWPRNAKSSFRRNRYPYEAGGATRKVLKPMTEKYENSVLDVADGLANSGAFPDRQSIVQELGARGYALAQGLFDDARRGERIDRMCAEARKKQSAANTRPKVKSASPTYYSLPHR
jgi:hypothetical protein